MPDPTRTRANVVDNMTVQREYLLKGVEAVAELYDSKRCSKDVLRLAVTKLRKDDEERAAPLVAWYLQNVGRLGRGGRGHQVGEQRPFKMQQSKEGAIFIRLTLPEGVRGEKAIADFESERRMVVTW